MFILFFKLFSLIYSLIHRYAHSPACIFTYLLINVFNILRNVFSVINSHSLIPLLQAIHLMVHLFSVIYSSIFMSLIQLHNHSLTQSNTRHSLTEALIIHFSITHFPLYLGHLRLTLLLIPPSLIYSPILTHSR